VSSFPTDRFDSAGVDVALAAALVEQAHTNLSRAMQSALIVERAELSELLDHVRTAFAVGDASDTIAALVECRDFLADTLGVDREV
jgi:hypothetical protein